MISVYKWSTGSQAYFLTHLHADHPAGLYCTWLHGLPAHRQTLSLQTPRLRTRMILLLIVYFSKKVQNSANDLIIYLFFRAVDVLYGTENLEKMYTQVKIRQLFHIHNLKLQISSRLSSHFPNPRPLMEVVELSRQARISLSAAAHTN